jgi:hypothetical protein
MKKTTESTTRTVTPNSAIKSILACIRARRPVMLHGAPGIGKSEIIFQIGEILKRPVIDIRLALYDPSDIKGFPYFDPVSKTMKWASSSELPLDEDSKAIIFLDEIVSAPPAVQGAAYQLILNRKIGEYNLPEGVDIVAAGNRVNDRGLVYKMPSPLSNRFIHLELRTDADEWIKHAVKKNFNKNVIAYISHCKQDLFTFDPKVNTNAFATPRSWKFVSDFLDIDDNEDEILMDLISGTIGDGLAIKFTSFLKNTVALPKAIDILDKKVTSFETQEIGAKYSLMYSLIYELNNSYIKKKINFLDHYDTLLEFCMNNMPVELTIMGVSMLLNTFQIPMETDKLENFDKFYSKYSKYLISTNKK